MEVTVMYGKNIQQNFKKLNHLLEYILGLAFFTLLAKEALHLDMLF